MSNATNGLNAAEMMVTVHEERIQRVEENHSGLESDFRTHEKSDELRFQMITDQITGMGDRLGDQLSSISSDVKELKNHAEVQDDSIKVLKQRNAQRRQTWAQWKKILLWPAVGMAGGLLHHAGELLMEYLRHH